jgi:DNA-binding beta-propeller fold protein YncE
MRARVVLVVPVSLLPVGCFTSRGVADEDVAFGEAGAAYDTGASLFPGEDDGGLPPEEESDAYALPPAATRAHVFVANPERDTVTRVTVATLEALTAPVGDYPSMVVATGDGAHAVSLDLRSATVSILDADTLAVRSTPIREDLNTLAASPDGAWVMAWHDPDREDDAGSSGAAQSFSEVSFVRLADGAHFPMAVGFMPHGVRWSGDGALALVVSDGALALVDLGAETLAPELVEIAEDEMAAPPAEEVEISPSGDYALVRRFGEDALLLVNLATRAVEEIDAGESPTDLDVLPDGSGFAVVARGSREVVIIDAAEPFSAPRRLPFPSAAPYGSLVLATEGERGVLYTNASAVPSYVAWDLRSSTMTERTLVKPVAGVGVGSGGQSMLVFHTQGDAEGADEDGAFYGRWAVTAVDLEDHRASPAILAAEPANYAVTEDGAWGYFTLEGQRMLAVTDFGTLLVDEISLPSAPLFAGAIPGANGAWASQEHELGRLSFYDPVARELDTVTGFELNAEVEH